MRFLVCLAVLTLAACDSSRGEEQPSLIGTWEAQTNIATRFAVVSETQTAVDINRPGTGSISVTGGVVGTLDHLGYRSANEDGTLSFSLTTGPVRRLDRPTMVLSVSPTSVLLSVYDGYDWAPRHYFLPDTTPQPHIALASGGIDISNLRLASTDELRYPDDVVVAGSLVFPTVQYVAGQERPLQVIPGMPSTFPGEGRVEFGPDGTFRGLSTHWLAEGTWTSPGEGEIEVQILDPRNSPESYSYAYEFVGRSLVLGSDQDLFDPCTAHCLSYYETVVGLAAGTLVSVRDTFETTYSRAGS